MKAVVIGGGLGGLAAAVALRKVGWEVDVHERAPEFGEVGAGIGLFPNALSALAEMGVEAEVRRMGTPRVSGGLRALDGSWLTKLSEVGQQELVAIHRADLHRALLEALPPSCLHTSSEIDSLDVDADLVVAADGIRSHARSLLFPDLPGPVYAGTTAWRGIAPATGLEEVSQTLGPGKEVGVLPIGGDRVYWYGAMTAPTSADLDVRAEFGSWHDPLPRLIDLTPPEAVLRHDIHWLATPLPAYVCGNVALLGDAAHAMVPFLGQGACMAMEDAVVLAASVASGSLSEGLARYDRERRPRTQLVARASRAAGRFGLEMRNPVGIALRNTLFRLTPPRVAVRGMTRFSGWRAPELAPVS